MGIGIIFRDEDGNVVDPTLVKCLALINTLEMCRDMDFSEVKLEGDVLAMIKHLTVKKKILS